MTGTSPMASRTRISPTPTSRGRSTSTGTAMAPDNAPLPGVGPTSTPGRTPAPAAGGSEALSLCWLWRLGGLAVTLLERSRFARIAAYFDLLLLFLFGSLRSGAGRRRCSWSARLSYSLPRCWPYTCVARRGQSGPALAGDMRCGGRHCWVPTSCSEPPSCLPRFLRAAIGSRTAPPRSPRFSPSLRCRFSPPICTIQRRRRGRPTPATKENAWSRATSQLDSAPRVAA